MLYGRENEDREQTGELFNMTDIFIDHIETLIIHSTEYHTEKKESHMIKTPDMLDAEKSYLIERLAFAKKLFELIQLKTETLTLDQKQCGCLFDLLFETEQWLESVSVTQQTA